MANNNNINWMGNKVIGSGMSVPQKRTVPQETSLARNDTYATQMQTTQSDTSMAAQSDVYSTQMQSDADMMSYTYAEEGPPTLRDINYIPGFLNSNIGRNIRAEFYINNSTTDRTGRLVEVGANYFVIEDLSRNRVMCDLYSVKFVTILG